MAIKILKSVKIGTQIWTTKNLNVSKFRNGDPITEALTAEEWVKAGKEGRPAWCYYENDPANGKIYGKMYNWFAVNDARGLAPKGWHIPTDAEWTVLTEFLGGEEVAGGKLKEVGFDPNCPPNQYATNVTGFSALAGGCCQSNGDWALFGSFGYWWSSSEYDSHLAWQRAMMYFDGSIDIYANDKQNGNSVRCIKDFAGHVKK